MGEPADYHDKQRIGGAQLNMIKTQYKILKELMK